MSDFVVSDLGFKTAGTVISVPLSGVQSNVMLMDPMNFEKFRRGQQYMTHGHLALKSPTKITVPRDGTWKLVIKPIGGTVSVGKPQIE